jgi:serine protease Do/serine protease DegQ
MNPTLAPLAAVLLLAATATPAAMPAVVGDTPLPSLSPMIKQVSPAVVNIATRGTIRQQRGQRNPLLEDPFFRRFFGDSPDFRPREREFQSAGSGVIFDAANGYIVTNAHVVENATEITVTLQDGHDLKAEVVGADRDSDVAVLKVPKGSKLVQIPLGNSERLEVGDFVVAIGNPFGLQHTVTSGIVSGLSRAGINPDGYEDFIQTDASINLGNSGGALVNLRGELIGINTAILSGSSGGNIGIGFAIPVNMARNVMDQILEFGSVKRGLLGVNIFTVTADIARSLGMNDVQGAMVSQVIEDSAAQKAGIRTGDVITSVNGHPVKSQAELRNAIGMLRVGTKVEVGLLRDGKPQTLTAVISEAANTGTAAAPQAPAAPLEVPHRALQGATFGDAPQAGGAVVRALEPNSPAARAGLRNADVVVSVNRNRVGSSKELSDRVKGVDSVILEVRRGSATVLIPLR